MLLLLEEKSWKSAECLVSDVFLEYSARLLLWYQKKLNSDTLVFKFVLLGTNASKVLWLRHSLGIQKIHKDRFRAEPRKSSRNQLSRAPRNAICYVTIHLLIPFFLSDDSITIIKIEKCSRSTDSLFHKQTYYETVP